MIRGAVAALLLASTAIVPARAEPVSISLGIASLTGAFVSVGTVSTVLSIGATVALSAGASLLQSAMQNKPSGSPLSGGIGAGLSERTISSRSSVGNRQLVVGRVLKAGAVFFERVSGPYLYRGYVIAAHEIDAVEEVRLGTTRIPLDASGYPLVAPYRTPTTIFFQVSTRLGRDDQEMDPIIAADFRAQERSFRQRGLATVVVKMYRGSTSDEADAVWGQSDPNWLFLVRGARVYDPRDTSQSASDPTTWQWSRNAALAFGWWLTHADGGRVSWSDVDLAELARSADVCDQMVPRRDGTMEPRYTADGVIDTARDPAGIFDDFLLTMLGSLDPSGGRYRLIAGRPRDPERTLTESSARGALDATSARKWRDVLNTVRTSFVAADREYAVATGPVWTDAGALAEDGTEKSTSVGLPFVTSVGHAQRIAKYLVQRSRLGRVIRRGEDIEALRHVPTDVVRVVYSGGLAALDGLYEITALRETERLDEFELELTEYDGGALYGWSPETDERPWSGGE